MKTKQDRIDEFLKDLQQILNKHHADIIHNGDEFEVFLYGGIKNESFTFEVKSIECNTDNILSEQIF